MTDDDNEPLMRGNNDGAFSKQELREGAPLDYISGKIYSAIKFTHRLFRSIGDDVPEDLPQPATVVGTSYNTKHDSLLFDCSNAFQYQVISYLALYNMLGLANTIDDSGETLFDRLLRYDDKQLQNWLNDIARRGMLSEISERT